MKHVVLASMCWLVLSLPAWATDYYVNGNCGGCSQNSCSAAQNINTPKQTIEDGLTCLGPGDTLYLRGATYVESIISGSIASGTFPSGSSWDAPVTLKGYPGEQAIWQAPCVPTADLTQYCRFPLWIRYNSEHHIILENLIFDGANFTKDAGYMVGDADANRPHDFKIINVEVRNFLSGIGVSHVDNVEVLGGVIHDNMIIPGDTRGLPAVAFYTSGATNVTFDGITFYNISGYAFQIYADNLYTSYNIIVKNNIIHNVGFDEACGMVVSDVVGAEVYNNILWENGIPGVKGCAIAVGHAAGAENVHVYHNTITDHLNCDGCGAVYVQNGNGHIVRNNLFRNNVGPDVAFIDGGHGVADHNYLTSDPDPLFVNASAHNYHLQSGSPARDAGVNVGITTDIEGTIRDTSSPDVGAYEFSGGVVVQAQSLRWKLDEPSGTTTVDSTGNAFTGTLVGAPTRGPGRQGAQSLILNGSTQYVTNTAYAWPANQSVTIRMWVKAATPAANTYPGLFGMAESFPIRFGAFIAGGPNTLGWDYGDFWGGGNNTGAGHMEVDYTPYFDKWTHVVLQAAGANNFKAIYINGQVASSATTSGSPPSTLTTGMELGRLRVTNGQLYFNGSLDDFRIDPRVWSAAEILSDYRSSAGFRRHSPVTAR